MSLLQVVVGRDWERQTERERERERWVVVVGTSRAQGTTESGIRVYGHEGEGWLASLCEHGDTRVLGRDREEMWQRLLRA